MPAPPADETKSVVIFYDACVPEKQLRKIVLPAITFAHHIFVYHHTFPLEILRDDYALFSEIERTRKESYRDLVCLFVTNDRGFCKKVKNHPERNNIKILLLGQCSSEELNVLQARNLIGRICDLCP